MNQLIVTTSWDDGTVTDLKLAQLLDKYGIKGTFYISRSQPDNLLQKQDIVAIDRQFECGAHTLSHRDLTTVSPLEAKREIEDSKTYLEDLLRHTVSMFCYPYGKYNPRSDRFSRKGSLLPPRMSINSLILPICAIVITGNLHQGERAFGNSRNLW